MYADMIRHFRRKCGLSQLELGNMLGVTPVSVSKWERGQTQPDIPTLTQMADIFNVSVDQLIDYRPADQSKVEAIQVMTRAFRQLTSEEQEKYIAVGRALFAHAFAEQEK